MGLTKRRLGRTGMMVTELGLGAMDTPQSEYGYETLNVALKSGINFIDTARDYIGSEYLIGKVISNMRSLDLHISTKTFSRSRDGCQHDVDKSLKIIGVDTIDIYQLHDVSTQKDYDQVLDPLGGLEGLEIAKYRGLIRHIGISSHNLDILDQAITSGRFDTVMVEYSAFFCSSSELFSKARQYDVGIIVMRPLGGSGRMSTIRSRVANGIEGSLSPSNLLRYVLSNQDISVVIPGARFPSRVEENVAVALSYKPLNDAEMSDCEMDARLLY